MPLFNPPNRIIPGSYSVVASTASHLASFISGTNEKAFVDVSGNASFNAIYIFPGGGSGSLAIGTANLTASTGNFNVAVGNLALQSNTTGQQNTAIGDETLTFNTTGHDNMAIGTGASNTNVAGSYNMALGSVALSYIPSGTQNTAVGSFAHRGPSGAIRDISASYNTAIGVAAMQNVSNGNYNTAIGVATMANAYSGSKNTAVGSYAMYEVGNTSGSQLNVGIGFNAGRFNSDGVATNNNPTSSVYIGAWTKPSASTDENEIVIGYAAIGSGSNTTVIGNVSTTATYLAGNVYAGTSVSASTYYGLEVFTSGVLEKNFLLTAEPYIANNYSVTYSGSVAVTESWVNSANSREIKRIIYAYTTGTVTMEVATVFSPADGTTIIAQTTASYVYSSGRLASVTKSRSV